MELENILKKFERREIDLATIESDYGVENIIRTLYKEVQMLQTQKKDTENTILFDNLKEMKKEIENFSPKLLSKKLSLLLEHKEKLFKEEIKTEVNINYLINYVTENNLKIDISLKDIMSLIENEIDKIDPTEVYDMEEEAENSTREMISEFAKIISLNSIENIVKQINENKTGYFSLYENLLVDFVEEFIKNNKNLDKEKLLVLDGLVNNSKINNLGIEM